MHKPLSADAIQQLFTEARSHHAWTSKPLPPGTAKELYELLKWGPTSANTNPARFVFVESTEAKERLYPALMGQNVDQVKAAPMTVIVASDEKFHAHAKRLFPAFDTTALWTGNAKLAADTAFRNSSLQGAYMILAARALGLDTCPMSGFDHAKVDEAFFKGTSYHSNFICTVGYGDAAKLFPRGPRLSFEEACKVE